MKAIYNIYIYHDPPPIPDRRHDFQAGIDGMEEMGMGTGRTAPDAIRDLADMLEMELDR